MLCRQCTMCSSMLYVMLALQVASLAWNPASAFALCGQIIRETVIVYFTAAILFFKNTLIDPCSTPSRPCDCLWNEKKDLRRSW